MKFVKKFYFDKEFGKFDYVFYMSPISLAWF